MNKKKLLTWLLACLCVGALSFGAACNCSGCENNGFGGSGSANRSSEDISSSLDDSSVLEDSGILGDPSSESGVSVDGASSEEISEPNDDPSYGNTSTHSGDSSSDNGDETSTPDGDSSGDGEDKTSAPDEGVTSSGGNDETSMPDGDSSNDDGDGISTPNEEGSSISDESSSNDEIGSSMSEEDSSNGEESAPDEDSSSEEISAPEESSSEKHTHVWGEWLETEKATCTKEGEERRDCENCDEYETRKTETLDHAYSELKYDDEQHWYECSCGDVENESLENHYGGTATTTEKAKCTLCEQVYGKLVTPDFDPVLPGPEKYEKLADGTINFGAYPQTKVTDETLMTALNVEAGTLPTTSDRQNWISYKYYLEDSNETDYMWYQDVVYGENTYRGVYFTSYRPYWTAGSSSTGNTDQDDNGYYTSIVYWFAYETLNWTILEEKDGTAFLLCNSIIDSQEYYDNLKNRTINGATVYANNYAESNIRKWLNETFYETAFTNLQQSLIQITKVDNSAKSTNPYGDPTKWNSGVNNYACENTNDKIFLLSEEEVTNANYGFASYSTYDAARWRKPSDYAQSQGFNTDSSYNGNGLWWLRSPIYVDVASARDVYHSGPANHYIGIHVTNVGVVPALKITL